eukprot:1445321-Amphidinium_carterae.1
MCPHKFRNPWKLRQSSLKSVENNSGRAEWWQNMKGHAADCVGMVFGRKLDCFLAVFESWVGLDNPIVMLPGAGARKTISTTPRSCCGRIQYGEAVFKLL